MQSAMRLQLRARTTNSPHHILLPRSASRHYSEFRPRNITSDSDSRYASTISNLRIGSKTRVIFQGFTGRQATANAKESIAWGTNIVGGVTPGREGTHLDLPVLPSVRRAMEDLHPDATGIYVPASAAVAAIEEAIEAEIPLIVAVAEHIPLHDMLRIHAILRTQTKSRLVGPNSPGIINAAAGERCRIGFQPLPCFSAGCVGIAAKSGTLSYEAVAATTRAGLGQSLCIGVGGDVLPGTDLVAALQVLVEDPATEAIALIGEIGGDGEMRAAQWLREYHAVTPEGKRKPVAALVAGRFGAWDGAVMGHAGAFWMPGEPSAQQKVEALRKVGVRIVNHPSHFGDAFKELMVDYRAKKADHFLKETLRGSSPSQKRSYHTARTLSSSGSLSRSMSSNVPRAVQPQQARSLHLDHTASIQLAKSEMVRETKNFLFQFPVRYLCLTMDRTTRAQCIITGLIEQADDWKDPTMFHKILFPPGVLDIQSLDLEEFDAVCQSILVQLKFFTRHNMDQEIPNMRNLLADLDKIFRNNEAKLVSMEFDAVFRGGTKTMCARVHNMRIELDDATVRSGGRLIDVHRKYGQLSGRRKPDDANNDGIVYHRLEPANPACNIGTLVNGAGLAMNTIDALADAGGRAANFLDTGGKATAETVKKAFEMVLADARVKVVFVNIFGGLTLGDMIARGIILAFQELAVAVPVVVRIRGTNEKEGQQIIAESGLPLFAFDDFDEAAAKAISLVNGTQAVVKEEKVKTATAEAAEVKKEQVKVKNAEVKQEEDVEVKKENGKPDEKVTSPDEKIKQADKPWFKW